jgi:hypothetical protein
MSSYQTFYFKAYEFNPATKQALFHYAIDEDLFFTEKYTFNFAYVDYDEAILDRALQTLFFMAGVSYYKTYLPPKITVAAGQLDNALANFLAKTYQRGLGEFFYVNQLDPRTTIPFEPTTDVLPALETATGAGILVGVGGGKDSLVTIEALRDSAQSFTTWSLDHREQLQPLVEVIDTKHLWVEREWDRQLLDLNKAGAYNGHVPISAIFAAVGTIVAILKGSRDVVVSNEKAANEPTLRYQGVDVNHQYSKSQEFEQDYQMHMQRSFGDSYRYYSFLRPLSELYIGELFAKHDFQKYRATFSSCNRAFRHQSDQMFWCGECPKCAFVFMILTPFIDREAVESIWNGKNLLLDPALQSTYEQLLGIAGDKPLECVGEIKESRAAMRLCQVTYPELQECYQFELPHEYDYKALGTDEMPAEIKRYFEALLIRPA